MFFAGRRGHQLRIEMQAEALSYLSPKAAVKDSPIHGHGLFAIEPFDPGEIVCVKGGHMGIGFVSASIATHVQMSPA
jgi:hypothetical protein